MREGVVRAPVEGLGAREGVERGRVIRAADESVVELRDVRLVVPGRSMPLRGEEVLPRRRLVRLAARAAHREHRRIGLDGARMAPHLRIAYEHDGPGRRVERLVVERKGRMTREDEVDLLVPERLLGVLLYDVVAGIRRDVGVDPERADVERSTNRSPKQRVVDDGDRVDLVESNALPARTHRRGIYPEVASTEYGRAKTR